MDLSSLQAISAELQAEALHVADKIRTKRIHELSIIERDLEIYLRDIVKVASTVCNVPIAQINFIDASDVWIKAMVGCDMPRVCPRDISFCNITIQEKENFLIVKDAQKDKRVSKNPWVVSNAIRFYAGVSLINEDGTPLGAICVIDPDKPRDLNQIQKDTLEALARITMMVVTKIPA